MNIPLNSLQKIGQIGEVHWIKRAGWKFGYAQYLSSKWIGSGQQKRQNIQQTITQFGQSFNCTSQALRFRKIFNRLLWAWMIQLFLICTLGVISTYLLGSIAVTFVLIVLVIFIINAFAIIAWLCYFVSTLQKLIDETINEINNKFEAENFNAIVKRKKVTPFPMGSNLVYFQVFEKMNF